MGGDRPTTMAPEVWKAYMGNGHFGLKCDVYSLGVVLFQLLTGELPYCCNTINAMEWLTLIAEGPPMQLLESTSESGKDLVRKMLAYDPADRPTTRQALQFSWFS